MFSFFSLLASYQEENKMNSLNIAVVMAPIMLCPQHLDPATMMANQGTTISIIQEMIDHSKLLFEQIKLKKLEIDSAHSSV